MVGIVTGAGTGLERTSAWVLGSGGQLGRARIGETQDAYVNAANGNLVLTSVDEFLVGLGPDASIARTYNSLGTIDDGDNGDRWQFGPRRRLTGVPAATGAGTTVTRIDWDGSETVFTWNSAKGAYVSTDGAGAYDTISRDASGVWSWKDGATAVKDIYDAQGRVTRTEDFDGNAVDYTYNSNGYLQRATTEDGDSVEFVYGNVNRPARVTELLTSTRAGGTNGAGPAGLTTRVRYEYDSLGRLQQLVVDLTPEDTTDTKRYFTTYTYDGDSQRVASVSQTDGSHAAFTYDASGRVKTVTRAVSDGVSQTTTFDYNAGNTKIIDALGRATFLHYDAAGQLTKMDGPGSYSGAPRLVTEFEYTSNGDLALMRKPTGAVVLFEYDGSGNRVKEREQVTPVEGGPATVYNVINRTFSNVEPSLLLTESVSATADPDGDGPATANFPLITRHQHEDRQGRDDDQRDFGH
jgi:YD repeat-containing protein